MENKKKWDIDPDSIKDEMCADMKRRYEKSKTVMELRTKNHDMFARISHNLNIFEKKKKDVFSEGSTQAAKRKVRGQTIQRVPDGELHTKYDKNSLEQVYIDFIFNTKILSSEFDGKDMLKNLLKTFNTSYDFGFAAVLTGFEKDYDGDSRISYTLIKYSDIFPDPDCDFIEESNGYFVRSYISQDSLNGLLDPATCTVYDNTYNEDVVKYLIENSHSDGQDRRNVPLADKKKGVVKTESVELITRYERGCDKFTTYVPSANAVLRTVDNYDPRKDVPIHFLILEPDPEYPLGVSQIQWTIAQQQFADAFQSTSYETLLRANRPPVMIFGNLSNSKIKMLPGAIWPMGTNPNNKVEQFPVETSTLNKYGDTLEQVSAAMMRNLNVLDGTVASDAKVSYSGTPQGVEAQREDKTININQMQKRVEIFFSEWANHALRSYVNAHNGQHWMTADEETRRRVFDIYDPEKSDYPDPIDGNKVLVDFGKLGTDAVSFEVRTGSLIQNEAQAQLDNIQNVLIPISQMLGNFSEQNHTMLEEKVLIPLVKTWLEKADIDISVETSTGISDELMLKAMQETIQTVQSQGQQLDEQAMMQQQMLNAMTPEQQAMATEPNVPQPPVAGGMVPPAPQEEVIAEEELMPVAPDVGGAQQQMPQSGPATDIAGMEQAGIPPEEMTLE